jgi:ABC-type bacteriocin/lantibiotic exporter with double-glycine peptidase domain
MDLFISKASRRRLLFIIFVYSILAAGVQYILFSAFWVLGDYVVQSDINLYLVYMISLLVVAMMNYSVGYLTEIAQAKTIIRERNRFRSECLAVILNMKYADYLSRKAGDWLNVLTNDTDNYYNTIQMVMSLVVMLPAGILMILLSASADLLLTCIGLAVGCLQLFTRELLNKRLVTKTKAWQNSVQESMQVALDAIRNVVAIRWLSAQSMIRDRYVRKSRILRDDEIKVEDTQNWLVIADLLFLYVGDLLYFLLAFFLLSRKMTELGSILAIYAVKQNFSNPFAFIGPLRSSLKQLDLFKDRSSRIFTYETETNDEFQHSADTPMSQDAVVLRNATFGYNNEKDIFNDFSLNIKQGARVKINGESGSGKTTLFRILMKLYDLNEGDLEILGSDIKEMTGIACRDLIGYIPQNFTIFQDTIKNNICLGDPNPNNEKMVKAASSVMMHDFIMALPHQYETVLYDNGKNLSAGQRARLAAARALYREPPILLIDELAANIDAGTRNKLIQSITSTCSNSTILIISHHIDHSYPIDMEVEVS